MRNCKLPHMTTCTSLIHERALKLFQSSMPSLDWHIVGCVSHTNTKGDALISAKSLHVSTEKFPEVCHKNSNSQTS